VKWGEGGAKQTSASAGTKYPSDVFSVVDSDGLEPVVKTYGTLLGCDGGTLTIQGTTYRIQRIPKRQQANGKKWFVSFLLNLCRSSLANKFNLPLCILIECALVPNFFDCGGRRSGGCTSTTKW